MNSRFVVGVGPFIGDLRTEVFFFRPFVTWLQDNLEWKDFFINSHFNRAFLYNGNSKFLPVYEYLSRNELNQKCSTNKEIPFKDYQVLVKDFKKTISKSCECYQNQIITYNLPYNASATKNITIYQRKFKPIEFTPYDIEEDNYILYIPDKTENIKRAEEVYNYLVRNYNNILVIGDFRTHLLEKNVIIGKPDYLKNSLKWILTYMSKAKVIVCPHSYWTSLANLQGYPVISYGRTPGMYKEDGEYNFGNERAEIFYYDKDIEETKLFKMLDYNISKFV